MSERGGAIVVNTGGASEMGIGDFFSSQSLVTGAVESMKNGMVSMKRTLGQVTQGFGSAAKAAGGVLSTMTQTTTASGELKKGMSNLYQYAKSYKSTLSDSLDSASTSALYLRNSLAAVTSPLASSIAPAVDYVADKFVEMFNVVNQLFSRLAGSSTYTAAKRFGQSWNDEADSAVNALSSVRRYLLGFDELNVLGSASGSGTSGSSSDGLMFEEREIEDGIASFADRLKAALESADWQTLGTMLGNLINDAVDSVDWQALGSKVGGYLNGAIQTAYYLLDSINFEKIGERIATFLNAALEEIDFETAGKTVALFFSSAIETFSGFVSTFDWNQFATKAADAINGFVSKMSEKLGAIEWSELTSKLVSGLNQFIRDVDWSALGTYFGERISDLLKVLKTAATEFDWSGAGEALASNLNALFKSINWTELGDWLNSTLVGLLDFGISFFNDLDVDAFCEGIKTALSRVDWEDVAQKLWTLLSEALTKLGEAASTLLFGGSTNVDVGVGLFKNGWTSLSDFIGTLVTVIANLTQSGSNWDGGLLSWFLGAAGTNAVDLVGNLTVEDDSSDWWRCVRSWFDAEGKNWWNRLSISAEVKDTSGTWWDNIKMWFSGQATSWWNRLSISAEVEDTSGTWWDNIKRWFSGQATSWWNRLSISAEVKDTSGTWWDNIRKWFSGQATSWWNRLYITAEAKDTSGIWWDSIKRWFSGQATSWWNRLYITAEAKDTSANWWSDIRRWFASQATSWWNRLTISAEAQDTSASWWENIKKWFSKQAGYSWNRLYIAAEAKDSSGTWWDSIKKWFAQQARNSWNKLYISAEVQNASATWWDNIKKWFGDQSKQWWNKLELSATVKNDSSSWWASIVAWWEKVKKTLHFNVAANGGSFAGGGYVTDGGRMGAFAGGGAIVNGRESWWNGVRKYAAGASRAHGTVFVAGEAGPEIVGHVNGRTEILNRSQLAQSIYSAVVSGSGQAVNALGRYLADHMTVCANAVVNSIGGVASMSALAYRTPALSTGAVLPYNVSAQLAKNGADIQDTLDANNEDLIQTIISVAGQIVAAVNGLQAGRQPDGLTARQVIHEINRRTQMFGVAPLQGV